MRMTSWSLSGSDFGRTNSYNAQQGKDHWPFGSFVIMEKNQPWTNRVVGETDDLHFAHRIDPTTLERDDANGTIIYPKHVHKSPTPLSGHREHARCAAVPVQQHRRFCVLWIDIPVDAIEKEPRP